MAYFLQQAMYGNVPRKMAREFIKNQGASAQELALAQQQAQNQAQMLQQNEQMYQNNPVPYEVDNTMQNYSPEEIDQIIGGIGTGELPPEEMAMPQEGASEEVSIEDLQMPEQEGAIAGTGLEGLSPDAGSMMANPNGILWYN